MIFADNLMLVTGFIAVVIFVSGFVQGALGFGYAIAALTTLPLFLGPQSAHVVVSLSGIPVMAMAVWTTRAGADWKSTGLAILGGVLLMPVGLLLFSRLSGDALIRGTGLAILILMLLELAKRPSNITAETEKTGSSFLAGAVSGFLAGAVSIGGPPIVAYAVRQSWPPIRTKAFITRCLLVIASAKGVALYVSDFITPKLSWYASGAAFCAVTGVWVGALASRNLETATYRKVVAVVLILLSCWWLYRGAEKGKPVMVPTPQAAATRPASYEHVTTQFGRRIGTRRSNRVPESPIVDGSRDYLRSVLHVSPVSTASYAT